MDLDERRHLERMREIHRKRVIVLEQQAGRLGDYVPPHIPIEIEELQEKIRQIDLQLEIHIPESGLQERAMTSETAHVPTTPAIPEHETTNSSVKREQVFISYSHKDEKWLRRLQTHLTPLEQAGIIKRWDDTTIAPGSKWQKEIEQAIKAASVVVLLVSAEFLASKFITETELPPLLAAAEQEGVVILPVIVSASLFEHHEILSQFQSVNPPNQPLSGMSKARQEAVLVKVAQAIKAAFQR
jgi:hypothetical protein